MGIVRYIAGSEIAAEADGVYYTTGSSFAYSRLKAEETEYAAGVSKLRLTFQVRTNAAWNIADAVTHGRSEILVNGVPVEGWESRAKPGTDGTVWTDIRTAEVTLPQRERGDNACTISVRAADSRFLVHGLAVWTLVQTDYPYALGDFEMPLTGTDSGSGVYIGGERHEIYIGNGSAWVKQDAYIGDGGRWQKMR